MVSDQKTKTLIDAAIKGIVPDAIDTLKRWISIPSVKAPGCEGAPYGPETRRMLDMALEDARRMGLDTKDVDGYAGQADLGSGEESDALGILGHLDVVPVGDGWTRPPFGAVEEDGKIYGRGTSDDKGPVVAALYAMAVVKQLKLPLGRRVRLIMGCDEETGMSDMAYYRSHAVMPKCGFSPDADYPLINIEKGGCHVVLRGKVSQNGLKIKSFSVGERLNVIPGVASCEVWGGEKEAESIRSAAAKLGFETWVKTKDENVLLIETTGKTGHAAMGESASNAIGQMLLILKHSGAEGAVRDLADAVGMTYYGENLGIQVSDRVSGPLTCSIDIITLNGDVLEAHLDIRYPLLMSEAQMIHVMQAMLPEGLSAEMVSSHGPHFVSEKTELVRELLSAYEDVTGERGQAMAIGGGTYAREMEQGVAFGAKFPHEPEMAHQADEYISIESFCKSIKIFTYSILRLAGKE